MRSSPLGCIRSFLCPPRVTPQILFFYCSLFLTIPLFLAIKMHFKTYLTAALGGLPVLASAAPSPAPVSTSSASVNDEHFKKYTIKSENITATLIPYGAVLTSLLVPDRHGNTQDILVGYDDPKQYLHDSETNRTFFGAVVGRYANRIKNGTFSIDGEEYHIPENEHHGLDTLHGGFIGYDRRNWTVTAHTESSITFTLLDQGFENFPGDVISHATYTLSTQKSAENPKGLPQMTTKLVSLALTKKTPIMLANHLYWNLNAFKEQTILNDTTIQMPLSTRFIEGDGILIPTGKIGDVSTAYGGALNFTEPKLIGKDIDKTAGLCGTDCTGYDTCLIVDRPPAYAAQDSVVPTVRMASERTGISLEIATNQAAMQIYSCNGQNGSIKTKQTQAKRNKDQDGHEGATVVNKYGCVVFETEDWIDGINQPEWGRRRYQIAGPEDGPVVNFATYQFGTF
ncbi:aldose 1-epimerase [Penicillium diatomitis]|uniref:Aldose 1-epimerase n=1 Tax=Penicillium diatomitis TaxID=2819901 RepID=A0A9W9XH36_9EURO|nr:aldose 1-epimerase [Penicillium diatomitis]KAJ5492903.1 aldose 1-epimerase [Penicillium diatomitis]